LFHLGSPPIFAEQTNPDSLANLGAAILDHTIAADLDAQASSLDDVDR